MAPALAHILLGLIVESVDFFGFALANDGCLDSCAFDEWAADGDFVTIADHNYFAQLDGIAGFAFELFDDDGFVFRSSILFSTRFDNCVHDPISSEVNSPQT